MSALPPKADIGRLIPTTSLVIASNVYGIVRASDLAV